MKKSYLTIVVLSLALIGCTFQNNKASIEKNKEMNINEKSVKIRDYIKKDVVIAHRGTTYWAPEETEAAYRWARNIGADYLELDLQMTKDGYLIALHDDDLRRTTNISNIFPKRKKEAVSTFTLKELRSLDAGSWFNNENPDRAKTAFVGQKILTLKDVVKIAEGYRIKRRDGVPVKKLKAGEWSGHYVYEKDPLDNENRPGIYAETKHPKYNVEEVLAKVLIDVQWDINHKPKDIETFPSKVGVGNSQARFILQSFSPESIQKLEQYLPGIPKCLLLWKPEINGNIKESYGKIITFAVNNNVQIMGTSIAGEPNNYGELTASWMTNLIHNSGIIIHPYTFDTQIQLNEYSKRVDGVFTNRAELALEHYKRLGNKTAEQVLTELGY